MYFIIKFQNKIVSQFSNTFNFIIELIREGTFRVILEAIVGE